MSTEHYCKDGWQPGPVNQCPKHERNRNKQELRISAKDRAKVDKAAGTVGRQGDGYIHGGNDVGDFKGPARKPKGKRYL